MVPNALKTFALLSVLCVVSIPRLVRGEDGLQEQQGQFIRPKDMMDGGGSIRRNLPREKGSSSSTNGGSKSRNGGGSNKGCPGSTCLSTDQRRIFFDTFWWQSYFGPFSEDRKLHQQQDEAPRRKLEQDQRKLEAFFEPSCSEFGSFNNYVCPCQEDACDSQFSSYDYCADYLKLGERFGDNYAPFFGNTGPFIDSLKGCVGFVEECCDYPRYCCEKSCLDGDALCDLYTSAGCEVNEEDIPPQEITTTTDAPTRRKRRAAQVEDEEVNSFRKLADESFPYGCTDESLYDCTILKYFGKDLCPCEKGSYLPKKDTNAWEPNPWEKEASVAIAFCNHVAPGCPHCEPFVETCCATFDPPYYIFPYYYD